MCNNGHNFKSSYDLIIICVMTITNILSNNNITKCIVVEWVVKDC